MRIHAITLAQALRFLLQVKRSSLVSRSREQLESSPIVMVQGVKGLFIRGPLAVELRQQFSPPLKPADREFRAQCQAFDPIFRLARILIDCHRIVHGAQPASKLPLAFLHKSRHRVLNTEHRTLNTPSEARVHFHIPLYAEPDPPLHSTQSHVTDLLDYRRRHPDFCTHYEIETYTWGVLPGDLQRPIVDQIAEEYAWVLGNV